MLSDNANKQAGQSSEHRHRESDDTINGGAGADADGDRWGRAQAGVSNEEERRRSLALHSDLPTPYLVVTNLPADVAREELFEAFR